MTSLYLAWLAFAAAAFSWAVFVPLARIRRSLECWPTYWISALVVALVSPIVAVSLAERFAPSPLTLTVAFLTPETTSVDSLAPSHAIDTTRSVDVILWIYLCGLGWRGLQIFRGFTQLRRLEKSARFWKCLDGIPVFRLADTDMIYAAGIVRKRIMVGDRLAARLDADQVELVIRHERAHLLRNDPLARFLLDLVSAASWWIPFTHHLVARWQAASEFSCDAFAVKGVSRSARRKYARALVCALSESANRARQCPVATFSPPSLRNETMRITHILENQNSNLKKPVHVACVALFGVAMTSVASIALAQPKDAPESAVALFGLETMVHGRQTSEYGLARDPSNHALTLHTGIDVAAPAGTPIHTPRDAVVVAATDTYMGSKAWGNVVILDIGEDTRILFAHLKSLEVSVGDTLSSGDVVAQVGQTGRATRPHVHIETFVNEQRVTPRSLIVSDS